MIKKEFQLQAPFKPTGDQPQAIKKLVAGLKKNYRQQTLVGVTGSGKTFTMAQIIQQTQRPALIISHNKTLAAQLSNEFQQFFPKNAVSYFVSYYDYYQPEAYIPSSDTYIEKESQLNEEIDRLRHAATQNLLSRSDTIVVASVSCIYGLGSPKEYDQVKISLAVNKTLSRQTLLKKLTELRYSRNDLDFKRGTFRLKGEIVEIFPAFSFDSFYRLRYNQDTIETIQEITLLTQETLNHLPAADIYPASHYVAPQNNFTSALKKIAADATKEVISLKKRKKLLEAQRLKERTTFDLEMLRATGYCNGIENYSRYFDGRAIGRPPYTLMDYLPANALIFVDESHMTLPQIKAMSKGDQARKQNLINYGFRLKAAADNRPLTFAEFTTRAKTIIFVSATPQPYELEISQNVAEQLIRPTGLLDPTIEIKPTKHQVDDLLQQIKNRLKKKQRVLVTTLTKKMSEELTDYLQDEGIKVQYLHSDVETLDRLAILRDLRLGVYDVIVGINLLREGLDLPEVSLIAILDADQEGYLRSATALIQTIGRAARHQEGHIIMYADRLTKAMRQAIQETSRRRKKQQAYNQQHGITPQSIIKNISDSRLAGGQNKMEGLVTMDKSVFAKFSSTELAHLLKDFQNQMELASQNLEFEKAAALRDQAKEIERLIKKNNKKFKSN
ncbi:excinuclease ABC subunit UvrB [Patescibacteria group bacterium]|nr:excinuclease ABC subunit UvrB [Patescibacteria group bacterium]